MKHMEILEETFMRTRCKNFMKRLGNAILNELRSYDKNTTIPMEIDDNLNLNEKSRNGDR